MGKDNVVGFRGREAGADLLTELLRAGARQLIEQAVEAELQELLEQHSECRTAHGKAGVTRNGYLPERELQTGVGPVTVRIPKIRSKTGDPVTFRSALVPPYVRKTKSLEAALPWLYLKGISSGEMSEALTVLVGQEAKGLSASTVSRLKQVWAEEYSRWRDARLDKDRWVYVWVDGIYSGLRAEQAKLCALVVVGVNDRGEKHFLAIEDGVRESTQSWREVLLQLKSRGMHRPQLAIGDGAMGFWAALEEIYPETRQQRCWMHKTMNVLNYLPKSTQGKAKQALHDICRQRRGWLLKRHSSCSSRRMRLSIQRRRYVCKKTGQSCWHSTTSRHNTGKAFERPIRLNRRLQQSGIAQNARRVVCLVTACCT
jgi:putative transposase